MNLLRRSPSSSSSLPQFTTASLLISDYYDKLVNQIDVYTEKLAERFADTDKLPKEPQRIRRSLVDANDDEMYGETFRQDPYSCEYKYADDISVDTGRVEPGVTRAKEYLDLVRTKAIGEINKAREHNLNTYELRKDAYKINRDEMTDERLRELKSRIFAEKFCFLLMIDTFEGNPNQCLYKLYTVITDFYLNRSDLNLLR